MQMIWNHAKMHTCQNAHMPKCTQCQNAPMLKWRTFPNAQHSQMQPCQMPRFAKCSSMRERCWLRTPTYELIAAKLRKGLKGRGNRTSAVFKLQCHPRGPLLCLQRLQFTSANSFNFFNVTSAKQKPANCFNSQVPRSLQNCFQFSSATQRPGNCFNSQVPGKLAPTIACKLLPLTGAE